MLGKGSISQTQAYWFLIVLNAIDIPLGLVGVGRRPGLWSPERPRPSSASALAGESAAALVYSRTSAKTIEDESAAKMVGAHPIGASSCDRLLFGDMSSGWFRQAVRAVTSFFSAFLADNGRRFRWYFALQLILQAGIATGTMPKMMCVV